MGMSDLPFNGKLKFQLEGDETFFTSLQTVVENHKLIYNKLLDELKEKALTLTQQKVYELGLEVARNNKLQVLPDALFMELHYMTRNIARGNYLPRQFSSKGHMTLRSGRFFQKKGDRYTLANLEGTFVPSVTTEEFEEAYRNAGLDRRYDYVNIGVSPSLHSVEINFTPRRDYSH